ncbi:MAG: ATP-binding cassette domain-containing protein, partial [Hyphomicrobiaceae bacterium]|nr:ATP-binding cassette domain-containing protein [Hyphomicrobiaceae bacterium]
MAALLEVKGLRAFYGPTASLHDVSFELEEGGITTLLGANGAGKTTTLRAICGMVRREGEINFEGRPINGEMTENIVRLGVAHVPEGRGTFVGLSVEENLKIAAYVRKDKVEVARDLDMVLT